MSSVISTSSAAQGASCLVRRLRASCCFRQGLELVKQDLHPFAHLYLGQQDTYGAIRVDEEVGAQPAGPPVATGPPALGEHPGEAAVVADSRDELAVTHVERRVPGVEATGGRFEFHQTGVGVPV